MADHASFSPFVGSLSSALARTQNKRLSPPTGSLDRALGAAASLGLSLAILRFVVYAYKTFKRLENEEENRSFLYNTGITFSSLVRQLLRSILLNDVDDSKEHDSAASQNEGTVISHVGSCHCESIHFEVSRSVRSDCYQCMSRSQNLFTFVPIV